MKNIVRLLLTVTALCLVLAAFTGCDLVERVKDNMSPYPHLHEAAEGSHNCAVCGMPLSQCVEAKGSHNCAVCGETLSEHTGGTATTTEKAVCTICGQEYGELVYVNTLVVGETHKIVIDDSEDNSYGYYIEWVTFVVEEAAHYTFAGEGLAIWIINEDQTETISMTGEADLQPGTYNICIADVMPGMTGEYYVSVTKSEIQTPAHVNTLVVGDTNKIVVTGETLNQYELPIEWVVFTVEEKAVYTFVGDSNTLVYIFADATTVLGVGSATLEPDTYLICIGNGVVGEINVAVTKSCAHEGGTATCTAKAVCETCGQEYGELAAHVLSDVVGQEPTCEEDGYTAYKACANCDHVEGKVVLPAGHKGHENDFVCDGCGEKIIPADGTTLTFEQVIALAKITTTTQKYYVTGTITKVLSTTYGNMIITDGTNEFQIRGLFSADGSVRYDKMTEKPVVGDKITIYAIVSSYNGEPQMGSNNKGTWLTAHVAHEHKYEANVTAPTCLKNGYTTHTCSICGDDYKDAEVPALGHTTENGVCDNCGLTIGGSAPVEVTVSKSAQQIMGLAGLATSNGTGVNNKEIALDGNVSVIFSQGKASTPPAYYSPAIRLYQNGAVLTVKGTGMKTIVITVNSSAGDGPIKVSGGKASTLTNMTYTITVDEGVEEVVITTTGTDKNSRVYVSNIKVVYEQ